MCLLTLCLIWLCLRTSRLTFMQIEIRKVKYFPKYSTYLYKCTKFTIALVIKLFVLLKIAQVGVKSSCEKYNAFLTLVHTEIKRILQRLARSQDKIGKHKGFVLPN